VGNEENEVLEGTLVSGHSILCFQCVAEYKVGTQKFDDEQRKASHLQGYTADPNVTEPDIETIAPADTWVPVWQQQQLPGQVIMACVALPVCIPHVVARKKTAEEQAVAGGRLLQGSNSLPPRGQVN
jgi:hypothetical protein